MNRIFRIVWNKTLGQLVVVSEHARSAAKGGRSATGGSFASIALKRAALAVAVCFAMPAAAQNLAMPSGAILDINNGSAPNSASNTANVFQTYTVTFTPTTTGNNYILFAFRQDPAYWTFGNVGMYAAGDTTTNLFTNPLFTQGGEIGNSGVQAPAGWGVVYQTGTLPDAAGTWHAPGDGDQTTDNVNTSTAGSWYDGAVGSFDGIYQGVDLVAGITYTINFTALSNDPANTAGSGDSDVEMGVFAGTCVTLTGPVANCVPDNPDFTVLATPDEAANAGGPSVVTIDSTKTTTDVGTAEGAFDGGTLVVDQDDVVEDQDFTISGNGGTIDQNGHDVTIHGTISDATDGVPGSLDIVNGGNGGSVTLTGDNTYTGGTSVGTGGTLVLADDGSIASSSGLTNDGTFDIAPHNGDTSVNSLQGGGTVHLGGNGLDITNAQGTYSGTIDGTGHVSVTGGEQTFTGVNSYTGGTTVSDATVSIDNGQALGTGEVSLDDGTLHTVASTTLANDVTVTGTGVVDTDTGTTLAHSGTVSGTGDFVKDGEGTLVQSGTMDHTGAVIVNDGTLVLSGNNTYGGGTTINAQGTLEVSNDANLGSAGGGLTFDGGTLHTTGDVDSTRAIALGEGGAIVATDADTTFATTGGITGLGNVDKEGDGTLRIDGGADQNGGFHVGAGTLVLNGDNAFLGATTVAQGATLQVDGAAALGAVAGGPVVLENGTLATTGDVDTSKQVILLGGGTIDTGANTTTTTRGNIVGSGTLVKSGEGTLVLATNNGFGGDTRIDEGTLQIAGDGNLGVAGDLIFNGGSLHTTGDVTSTRDLVLNTTGTIATDAGTTMSTSGTVSGAGGLVKNGDGVLEIDGTASHGGGTTVNGGTLILTGANTYTGGTVVNAGGTLQVASDANLGDASSNLTLDGGTLHTTDDLTSGRDIALASDSTLAIDTGKTVELDGTLSGAGGLTQSGGTLVLTHANTYTGGTTVSDGTISIADDAALGTGALTLADATLFTSTSGTNGHAIVLDGTGTLETRTGTTLEHTGTVSGTGDFIKNGYGVLTQTGVLSHDGKTIVNGGTLELDADNTYTGGTVVNFGTSLVVSRDTNLGDAAGDLTIDGGQLTATQTMSSDRAVHVGSDNAAIYNDAGLTLTLNGDIDGVGQGALVKNGQGTLVLSGNNTFAGGLYVGEGTVEVSNDANLGAAGVGVHLTDGALHTTGDVDSTRDIVVDGNGAQLVTDAGTTFATTGDVTGYGMLLKSGAGTLQVDGDVNVNNGVGVVGGKLILTGNNGYQGPTVVQNGAILQVDNEAALGAAGSVLALADGTLATTGDTSLTKLTGISGVATFDVANDTVTTVHGDIGNVGNATLVKTGSGTLVLDGGKSFTGDTRIDDGTLQIANDANLGTGGSLVFTSGTLHATGDVDSQRDIVLAGDGLIDVDGGMHVATGGTVSGAGALVKDGEGRLVIGGVASHTGGTIVNDGVLVLTASNTYTGGNTINGGVLQVRSDANLGDASNGIAFEGGSLHTTGSFTTARNLSLDGSGTIATDIGTTVKATGSITGLSGLVKDGAGTLDISGAASHGGGTTVNAGTLILGGNNTYTGGTTINGGTLQVSSDANLGDASNDIAIDGGNLSVTQTMTTDRDILIGSRGASITTADGVTLNQQGDMSGTGGLVKLGGGTLVVSGNNSFTGGTLIQGGVIRINTGSSLGTGQILLQGGTLQTDATLGTGQQVVISGNSGVNVAAGTTTVLSGDMVAAEGSACFVKSGKGYLSLTGRSSLASGTCVQDGVLSANGVLSSSFVQVDKVAMLRGTGFISGPVNVEGRLAAGNSPGTLTVAGTVTMQPGSTLQVDIDGQGTGNGAGNYSRVLVTGAGNQFVANGTLAPTLRGITGNATNTYTPAMGSTYRIVTAEGGVTGRFTAIDQPTDGLAANTRFLAFYGVDGGHSIDLRVAPVSYADLLGGSAKRNGLAAAGALDGAMLATDAGNATAAQNGLLYAVSSLGADQVASMVGSLSGEVHADQAAAARNAGLGMQRDVSDHLGTDVASADVAHRVWANVTRDGNRSIADGQGSGFETGTDRTTAGIDLYAENGTVIGVAATHHDTNVIAHGGSGTIRGNSGIVYAQQAFGGVVLDAMAARGTTDWSTRRADPMGGAQLESRTSGKDTMASATLRLPMQTASGNRIEPYASVIWQKVERDAVRERGDSVAALSVDELSEKGTRVLAGVAFGSKAADPLSTTLTWRAGLAVGADTGDLLAPTVHDTLAGQRFDTAAPGVGRGFVQVNANGTMRLGKRTYLYGGLTAEEGSRRAAYGVTAGVRVTF